MEPTGGGVDPHYSQAETTGMLINTLLSELQHSLIVLIFLSLVL